MTGIDFSEIQSKPGKYISILLTHISFVDHARRNVICSLLINGVDKDLILYYALYFTGQDEG